MYCGQQDGKAALGCARIRREADSVPQQFEVALGFILLQHIIVTHFMQSHNAVLIHSWRALAAGREIYHLNEFVFVKNHCVLLQTAAPS